jgi:hypothetical protein
MLAPEPAQGGGSRFWFFGPEADLPARPEDEFNAIVFGESERTQLF